ncbi:MAG: SurA N-terminal domain-containing protein [Candidatus Omnitrophota bacterium]
MNLLKIIIFILIGLCFNPNFVYTLEDKLVAIVNDEIITESDVKDFLNTIYLQLSSQYEGEKLKEEMAKIEDEVVDRLIEDKLIVQRGKELGAEIKNSAIETRYQSIKEQFPSDEEFDLYLKMKGLTPADLRAKISEQILMREIVEYEVQSKVFVHPQEVTDYYNAHLEEFTDVEKLDLDSIFIRKENSDQEAFEKVQKILKLLNENAEFSDLRERFSDAPPLGIVRKGALNEEIEKVVFALKIKEVSAPIETNIGFYLVKLKDRVINKNIPLEEIKDQISQFLQELKFQEKFIEWIDKLKNEAYILIK